MKSQLGQFMYAEDIFGGWSILNTKYGNRIGDVVWYPPWKQYVFEGAEDCVFSADCLQEIVKFLLRLNEERKEDGRD